MKFLKTQGKFALRGHTPQIVVLAVRVCVSYKKNGGKEELGLKNPSCLGDARYLLHSNAAIKL